MMFVVRVAERSKAPDLRSGPLMWAWVQIPFLTILFLFCLVIYFFSIPLYTGKQVIFNTSLLQYNFHYSSIMPIPIHCVENLFVKQFLGYIFVQGIFRIKFSWKYYLPLIAKYILSYFQR